MALAIPIFGHKALKHITYRNTMLECVHPEEAKELIILKTDDEFPEEFRGKPASFISANVKSGCAFYGPDVAQRYGKVAEDAIYCGTLLSSLRFRPVKRTIRVLVVKDGERGTGDCHGIVSPQLLEALRQEDQATQEARMLSSGRGLRVPKSQVAQFRMVVPNQHLVKGTIREGKTGDFDLILPLSAFKGNKPNEGENEWEAWIGVREWASPRKYRMGYQVWQYIPFDVLSKDIDPVEDAAYLLNQWDRKDILEHLGIEDPEMPPRDVFFEILLASDKTGVSLLHPVIAKKVAQAYRNRWRDLALNAGQYGIGLMGVPDDSLPLGVVAAPDIHALEVICTRYPLRGPQDVRVFKNAHKGAFKVPHGCVAMSHATALLLAGDFDGDIFVLRDADDLPHVTQFLKGRELPPDIVKEKKRLKTPWSERTKVFNRARTMSAMIAPIANSITKAVTVGRWDIVYQLGQQLQIAVDGIKYDGELDEALVNKLMGELDQVDWLVQAKDKAVFSMKAPTESQSEGTIARIWSLVAQEFTPVEERAVDWEEWRGLVPAPSRSLYDPQSKRVNGGKIIKCQANGVKPGDIVDDHGCPSRKGHVVREVRKGEILVGGVIDKGPAHFMAWKLFLGPIATAMKAEGEERDEAIAEICQNLRRWAEGESLIRGDEVLPGLTQNREEWFKAFWHIGIDHRSTVCFVAFPDLCIKAFADLEPEAATKAGIRCKGGKVVSWAAAQPLIDSLPPERRARALQAMRQFA